MSDRIADLEPQVKQFLVDQGFTWAIRLQQFGTKTPEQAMLIRRDGSGPLPEQLPIDHARIYVLARAAHPHDSFLMVKQVADAIHGFGPGKMGTLDVLHAELVDGPTRDDDAETRKPVHVAAFDIRLKT